MEYLKKIAVAAVVGKVEKPAKDAGTVQIMRVFGIANATGVKETNFGQSIFLKGQIRATNLKTGAQYEAAIAYLPDIAINPVANAIDAGAETAEFAFDIGVKYSEKGSMGYEYTITPLVEPSKSDPLEMLAGRLPSLQLTDATKSKK